MKDIHHTCRCTGQQFTFKEWCAWIKSHEKAGQNSSEFVVLSHDGFDFNIHDVCLTPNRPVRLFNTHCVVEVKTAQSPNGRWDYGLDVNLHNSGHYVGAGFVDDVQKGYPTEAAAILAALLDARKSAERELADCSGRSRSNSDNEDDEGGFIKDSTLAQYYSIVSISGDAVGCAPVAEVLRNNPRPMPEQRIEANARLLAAAPDLLAALEIIVGIFEPDKLTPYRFAREAVDVAKQIIEYVYGADERNRPTNESPSNDAEFLEWLYVRLVGTHGENPNTDYMQNLKSIIEKLR